MTRPTSVKPDNFFLLLFRALRQRRVPIALRLASHSLILVALALLIYAWVMGMQFRQAMQQQADALGQSLITQTAASATELLVSNDILSLNVLLNNLVKNPLVAHAAIYSVDQRILAEAGSRPKQSLLGATEGLYSTPITFQEVIAGHLRISLDMQQFQQPMMISLQSMGLISLILLILALYFSLRLGRQISTPLLQLRVWLRDPDNPAPGAELQNELGDLARDLEERLVPEKPPAPEPEEAPLPQNFDDILLEDDEADLRSRKVEASASRKTTFRWATPCWTRPSRWNSPPSTKTRWTRTPSTRTEPKPGNSPQRPPLRANRNTVRCWRSSSALRNSCAGCRAAAWWISCNAIATAWNRPPASTRAACTRSATAAA